MNYVLNRAVQTNKTDCKLFFPVCVFEYKYNNGIYKWTLLILKKIIKYYVSCNHKIPHELPKSGMIGNSLFCKDINYKT